ncbi:Serine/threonine protein phosphatase [Giardia muris]|uniref:Serine/threonine-protein phosphatase n=1 Tax=Giardia muris TaxID=5742 RepID=A0A4Z1TD97_GIAMU|nr:Serine/threonine protein phosphatase [Giardia muris]|eukprot:TNJ30509.1 Serine/threonine protein phosphatase [Giardia muris]
MALDVDKLLHAIRVHQRLPSHGEIMQITDRARAVFFNEPNLLSLSLPIIVIGDIHGQLFDLFEIFKIAGEVPTSTYLFLGDYVDRGTHSLEVILYLFLLKIRHPQSIYLLRGNHEDEKICQSYGFLDEIYSKFSDCDSNYPKDVWRAMIDTFETLPIAALIQNELFSVHAGLSPSLQTIDQMNTICRFRDFPEGLSCLFSDLLWSDPSSEAQCFERSTRGAGCSFGLIPVLKFLYDNSLSHILRSHQLCYEGFVLMFGDLLSTVWSAPDYTQKRNFASVLTINENLERNYEVFECSNDFDLRATLMGTMAGALKGMF